MIRMSKSVKKQSPKPDKQVNKQLTHHDIPIETMRKLFSLSQTVHRHDEAISVMKLIYAKHSFNVFYTELSRDIKLVLQNDPKSPFTKQSIEFIGKLLTNKEFQVKDVHTSRRNKGVKRRRKGEDDEDEEVETSQLVEKVITDLVMPFLFSLDCNCRYNSCVLVDRLFFHHNVQIDPELFSNLKLNLTERCADRDRNIRAAAAKTLRSFQNLDDVKDGVTCALKFHLKNDPDADVRLAALNSLKPVEHTMNDFVRVTRDVSDTNRKAVYNIIADKISIKKFTIEQRLTILKNGLNERVPLVKRIVENKLIPAWIKAFDDDLEKLLSALDIQSDPELIDKMLRVYFEAKLDEINDQERRTNFHSFIDDFRLKYLDDKGMLTKLDLTVENALLWRNIAEFCKRNQLTNKSLPKRVNQDEDAILTNNNLNETEKCEFELQSDFDNPTDVSQDDEIISQESVVGDPQVVINDEEVVAEEPVQDLLDLVIPDLPYYCKFLSKYIIVINQGTDISEFLEFEFIFDQLMKILVVGYEIGDEAQRNILSKSLRVILMNDSLNKKFTNHINPLIKGFAKKVFTVSNDLLAFCVEVISEIQSRLDETINESQYACQSPARRPSIEESEINIAKLTVRLQTLKDELENAKDKQDFLLCAKIKEEVEEVEKKREDLNAFLAPAITFLTPQSPHPSGNQTPRANNPTDNLAENPEVLDRCLQIFSSCLQYGNFKEINAVMLAHIEKLILTALLSTDYRIREGAFRALGLACMISEALAKQYSKLFIEALNNDVENVRKASLKAIFDILCTFDLDIFAPESDQTQDKTSTSSVVGTISQGESQTTNQREKELDCESQSSQDMSSELDNLSQDLDSTINTNNHQESLHRTSETHERLKSINHEDINVLLNGLFEEQLKSKFDSIRDICIQGIGKLLVFGKMRSIKLLSQMLILWYDKDSTSSMKQFLGFFFPMYAGVTFQAKKYSGQQAYIDCFIPSIELLYEESLPHLDSDQLSKTIDHMINFLLELIVDQVQHRLAIPIANKLASLSLPSEQNSSTHTLLINAYLNALSSLKIYGIKPKDMSELTQLLDKIELEFKKDEKKNHKLQAKIDKIRLRLKIEQDKIVVSEPQLVAEQNKSEAEKERRKAEPETEPDSEPELELEGDRYPNPEAGPDPDLDPDPEPDPDPDPEPERDSDPEAGPDPEAEADPVPDPVSEAEAETETATATEPT